MSGRCDARPELAGGPLRCDRDGCPLPCRRRRDGSSASSSRSAGPSRRRGYRWTRFPSGATRGYVGLTLAGTAAARRRARPPVRAAARRSTTPSTTGSARTRSTSCCARRGLAGAAPRARLIRRPLPGGRAPSSTAPRWSAADDDGGRPGRRDRGGPTGRRRLEELSPCTSSASERSSSRPLKELRRRRVLDLGCGEGAAGATCSPTGSTEIVGVDVSAARWSAARRLGSTGCRSSGQGAALPGRR